MNPADLPLDAVERRHYEELKLADKLSAASHRAMAAELQRLIKFCAQQEPVGETYAGNAKNGGVSKHIIVAGDTPVGIKLYVNQFAGDYLDLLELWKGVRRLKRFYQAIGTSQAPKPVVVQGRPVNAITAEFMALFQGFEVLLARHNIDLPPDDEILHG